MRAIVDPLAKLVITQSRSHPGLPSIRPYPTDRYSEDETLQEYLHRMGFVPGDTVYLIIDHSTRPLYPQVPPPGQLGKRKGRGKR